MGSTPKKFGEYGTILPSILPTELITPGTRPSTYNPHRLVRSPLPTKTTTTHSMDRYASASIPSSTSAPPYSIPLPSGSFSWLYTTLAVVFTLLALEQSVYRYKKRHLPGAKWTIPIIGKFADSMKPTMEGYMRQWNAGDLSAVSVFNMSVLNSIFFSTRTCPLNYSQCSFIVMASSNEYSRKILNSPTYAEPCLVHSAKQIVFPDNW